MSRRTMFAALLALVMVAPVAMAQQPPQPDSNNRGGGGGGRGNFDPAQFRQRMEDRLKEQLGVSDDEWKVLQPKVTKVFDAQRAARAGGRFGGRGGRGGDNNSDRQRTPVEQAGEELQKTLDNKDSTADQITAKLTALRESRDKARTELASAQKELKEVLTQRQEATLVMNGLLD